uniref:DNA mismatch repair protein MutS n=1 Tax=Lygus hesperus TaxID=30085 RepID=A0A0A9Z742_LYGHE
MMANHPRYTAGCGCCEAELQQRQADRRANNRIKDIISRVHSRFYRMKLKQNQTIPDPGFNRKIVKLADVYLDEIRYRPELMRRYGPLAGVTLPIESESESDEETRNARERKGARSGPHQSSGSSRPGTSRGNE